MKIQVTQDHIDKATKRDSHHCMIADAIHDYVPEARYVLVDLQSIRWSDLENDKRHFYFTPINAQNAIIKFDRGQPVKPFEFTLTASVRTRNVNRKWTGRQRELNKIRIRELRARKKRGMKSKKAAVDHEVLKRTYPSRFREFGVRRLSK